MENEKLGKAIAYLRKRAGYTQYELSKLLDISDKAVSKWERGLSCPDIALLAKLSILLDIDIESLLEGNVSHHKQMWKGVLIIESINGISATTQIYDKPMVYYLLSYFLLVGIKDILIICSLEDKECMKQMFGRGEKLGICLTYGIKEQQSQKIDLWKDFHSFIANYSIMILYDKRLIYGMDLTKYFQRAMARTKGITLLETQNKHNTIPILFCTVEKLKGILFNSEGFFSMTDVCKDELYVDVIGRGLLVFNLKNWNDILDASAFVKVVQKGQKEYISCIEEIAWRRGLISKNELKIRAEESSGTEYGNYVLNICKE